MKIWQIAVVSTTLGFALPAIAQMAAKAELRSDVEMRVKDRLGKFDTDKDGVVTRAEMAAYVDARRQARDAAEFTAMDTNKDGSISRAEFDKFHANRGHDMMAMMARGDGPDGDMPPPPSPPAPPVPPAPGAAPPAPPPSGAPPKIGKMHGMMGDHHGMAMAEGSGPIVIADAVKKALARFDMVDANKDGSITPAEREAARAAWRKRATSDG